MIKISCFSQKPNLSRHLSESECSVCKRSCFLCVVRLVLKGETSLPFHLVRVFADHKTLMRGFGSSVLISGFVVNQT
jgi:hypothetical protein